MCRTTLNHLHAMLVDFRRSTFNILVRPTYPVALGIRNFDNPICEVILFTGNSSRGRSGGLSSRLMASDCDILLYEGLDNMIGGQIELHGAKMVQKDDIGGSTLHGYIPPLNHIHVGVNEFTTR